MLNGALLGILEDAATAVLALTDGLDADAFFASRLAREEVLCQLRIMTETVASLPAETRMLLADIDWAGWTALGMQLKTDGLRERAAVWAGVQTLAPALLLWLRVYRRSRPEMFSFIP